MRSNAFLKSNKTALTVAPLPSVALFHECSMLIKAWVVLLPDIAPNRWESTFLRSAGFTKPSTTKSSATFDKMGVKDMGLKWLFTSRIGFCFGIGEMLSSFHDDGRRASMYEQFKMFTYIIIILYTKQIILPFWKVNTLCDLSKNCLPILYMYSTVPFLHRKILDWQCKTKCRCLIKRLFVSV